MAVKTERRRTLRLRCTQIGGYDVGIHAACGVDEAGDIGSPDIYLCNDLSEFCRRNGIGLHRVVGDDETQFLGQGDVGFGLCRLGYVGADAHERHAVFRREPKIFFATDPGNKEHPPFCVLERLRCGV